MGCGFSNPWLPPFKRSIDGDALIEGRPERLGKGAIQQCAVFEAVSG